MSKEHEGEHEKKGLKIEQETKSKDKSDGKIILFGEKENEKKPFEKPKKTLVDFTETDWSEVLQDSDTDDDVSSLSSMEEPWLPKDKFQTKELQEKKRQLEKEAMANDIFVDHKEFTLRAVIVGVVTGIIVTAININFGLRTGWTQGGSIFAGICAIALFKIFDPKKEYTKHEATITITVASTAGIMAACGGFVSSIPALGLMEFHYNVWELLLWAFAVGFLGVYFAFPLRKQMIIKENLRFPTGRATAETIKAMVASGAKTMYKANVLIICSLCSGFWSFFSYLIPVIESPPMPNIIGRYGFIFYINPLLIGGGMLSGLRASVSLFMGSVVGWGILAPIADNQKWVEGDVMTLEGSKGWILWVGISIMIGETAVQLVMSSRFFVNGIISFIMKVLKKQKKKDRNLDIERKKTKVPLWWCALGLFISVIFLIVVGQFYFQIQWYFILFAIPLSFLLSIVAIRSTGETDINPIGVIGKVTQLVFAGIAPGMVNTNILAAGIVAAGASQSGDMMQDLKTGYITRVAPRKQFWAQVIGISFGCVCAVIIYWLYSQSYDIGGHYMPAPAAHAWKAVAVLLTEGLTAIPKHSEWGMLTGLAFGVSLCLVYHVVRCFSKKGSMYVPSALAFGLGMLVPAKQSMAMFFGAMIFLFWFLFHKKSAKKYYYAASSGLITGEGLMGIVIAVIKYLGVVPLVQPFVYT